MINSSKEQLLADLSDKLVDLFTQQRFGADGASLGRAHGFVDGYMRVLLDSGLVSKEELLSVVARQREALDGPAMGRASVGLTTGAEARVSQLQNADQRSAA